MNVSKNHVVCARCHFTGLASGIDCAVQSSAESGPARAIEALRTLRYRLASSASAGAERGNIADSGWVARWKCREKRSPRPERTMPVMSRRHGDSMTQHCVYVPHSRVDGTSRAMNVRSLSTGRVTRLWVFVLALTVSNVASAEPGLKPWTGANP